MKAHLALLIFASFVPLGAGLANAQTVTQIQARYLHNLELRADGTVLAWGANDAEQTNVPFGLSGITAVSAGLQHSLALTNQGSVVAWGRDSEGQCNVPVGLSHVVQIAAGGYHNLALNPSGAVLAWGGNYDGECDVPGGLGVVKQIAAGGYHSLALKSDGTVAAWGINDLGQINVPVGLTGVVQISAGHVHSLALRSNGTVSAWGSNSAGQTSVPPGLTNVVQVAAGYDQSLALKSDGTVIAWGGNGFQQAAPPAGLTGVIQVTAGYGISIALKADGTIVGWGSNYVPPPSGSFAPPPQLVGPGNPAAPGQTVTTTTPAFNWEPVLGADSYGLYIEQLFSPGAYIVIFTRSVPAGQTSFTVPSAYELFAAGYSYRWNMTAHNSSGNGPANANFRYFSIGDVNPDEQLRVTSVKTSAPQPFHQGQSINYTITVADANGNLVSGATVTVDDGIISQSKQASPTDSNGRTNYSTTVPLNLSDGVYQLVFQATAPGYVDSGAVTTVTQLSGGDATPQLAITFPLGGELLAVSTSQTISANGNGPFYQYLFEFSTDDGATWASLGSNPQIAGTTNSPRMQWTVPNIPSTTCLVRVTGSYSGGTVVAVSNGFSIQSSGQNCSTVLGVSKQSQAGTTAVSNDYDSYRLGNTARITPRDVCVTPPSSHNPQGESIYDSGCLLTCLSMLTSFWNQSAQQSAMTPPTLNSILVANHSFTPTNGINNLGFATIYASSDELSPSLTWKDKDAPSATPSDIFNEYIADKLCNGIPVIVQFPNHYVIVIGADDQGFIINDPGRCPAHFGETLHLLDSYALAHYGQPIGVRGYILPASQSVPERRTVRSQEETSKSVDAVTFVTDSNADVLAVDPNECVTGYDSSSNSVILQIPDSNHFVDLSGDSVNGDASDGSVHTVTIEAPLNGLYRVDVVGLKTGTFELDATQIINGLPKTTSIVGTTSAGTTTSYFFQVGGVVSVSLGGTPAKQTALVGDQFISTLTINNSGSTDASAISLAQSLPETLSIVSVDGAQFTYDADAHLLTLFIDTLVSQDSRTITVVATSSATGTFSTSTQLSCFENNTSGSSTLTSEVDVTTTFERWQQMYFASQELNDPSVSGDLADPDNDGLPNLLEYAFNSDPRSSSTTNRPTVVIDNGSLSLIYTRAVAASDLTYTVEKSGDLIAWEPASSVDQVISNDGIIEVVRSSVPIDSCTKMFLHLRVSR